VKGFVLEDLEQSRIGIFDSGIGGLTVMRAVIKRMPHENIVYFGDTARVPYGCKSSKTVERYSIENAIFLMEQNIKVLVVACNTASAFAVDKLRRIFNVPIVDVVEPSVQRAIEKTKNGRIAVLGTKATIKSGIYQQLIHKTSSKLEVFSVSCPLFVPLVEEGLTNHPITELAIKEYLLPLLEKKVDTVILGCTHYPLLGEAISKTLGKAVKVIDSASCCAEEIERVLELRGTKMKYRSTSSHGYFVSDDPEKFRKHGEIFLGHAIENVVATNNTCFL
jgi:glutamate racemase